MMAVAKLKAESSAETGGDHQARDPNPIGLRDVVIDHPRPVTAS